MSRYIDAEALKKKAIRYPDYHYKVTIEDIDNIPTADVQEVKHGRWIRSTVCSVSYTCSICGTTDADCDDYPCYADYRVLDQQYCSCCGAKMDGGDEG